MRPAHNHPEQENTASTILAVRYCAEAKGVTLSVETPDTIGSIYTVGSHRLCWLESQSPIANTGCMSFRLPQSRIKRMTN